MQYASVGPHGMGVGRLCTIMVEGLISGVLGLFRVFILFIENNDWYLQVKMPSILFFMESNLKMPCKTGEYH